MSDTKEQREAKRQIQRIGRFCTARGRYQTAYAALQDHEIDLAVKYGRCAREWCSTKEKRRTEQLRAALDRASAAFHKLLATLSPRDWSYGVPSHWLCLHLSYEDATRPVGEPLSVVPPLSYGSTTPRV